MGADARVLRYAVASIGGGIVRPVRLHSIVVVWLTFDLLRRNLRPTLMCCPEPAATA